MSEPTRAGSPDPSKPLPARPRFCGGVDEMATDKEGKPFMRKQWIRDVPPGYIERFAENQCMRHEWGHIVFAVRGEWKPSTSCPFTPSEGHAQCLSCEKEQLRQNARSREYRVTNLRQESGGVRGRASAR